jgi:hypothetical protein
MSDQASGWQPIAKAPRDREIVILCPPNILKRERRRMAIWKSPYEAAPDEECYWGDARSREVIVPRPWDDPRLKWHELPPIPQEDSSV